MCVYICVFGVFFSLYLTFSACLRLQYSHTHTYGNNNKKSRLISRHMIQYMLSFYYGIIIIIQINQFSALIRLTNHRRREADIQANRLFSVSKLFM